MMNIKKARKVLALLTTACIIGSFGGCADNDTLVNGDNVVAPAGENVQTSDENDAAATAEKLTVYSPDGRSTEIPLSEIGAYINGGWYTERTNYSDAGYYVAAPAADEELLKFANTMAGELEVYKLMFSAGDCFEKDTDNPVDGPKHDFSWNDEYIWYEIADEDINTVQDIRDVWRKSFAPSSADEEYFTNFTEINGKAHVARVTGLGGCFMQKTYNYSDVTHISDEEVRIIGFSFYDYDCNGAISEDENDTFETEVFIMVLDNGRWKQKLAAR